MSNTITILNALTGEITEEQLTSEEISSIESGQLNSEEFRNQQQSKESAKTSALAKLAALGLTEEEIAAL